MTFFGVSLRRFFSSSPKLHTQTISGKYAFSDISILYAYDTKGKMNEIEGFKAKRTPLFFGWWNKTKRREERYKTLKNLFLRDQKNYDLKALETITKGTSQLSYREISLLNKKIHENKEKLIALQNKIQKATAQTPVSEKNFLALYGTFFSEEARSLCAERGVSPFDLFLSHASFDGTFKELLKIYSFEDRGHIFSAEYTPLFPKATDKETEKRNQTTQQSPENKEVLRHFRRDLIAWHLTKLFASEPNPPTSLSVRVHWVCQKIEEINQAQTFKNDQEKEFYQCVKQMLYHPYLRSQTDLREMIPLTEAKNPPQNEASFLYFCHLIEGAGLQTSAQKSPDPTEGDIQRMKSDYQPLQNTFFDALTIQVGKLVTKIWPAEMTFRASSEGNNPEIVTSCKEYIQTFPTQKHTKKTVSFSNEDQTMTEFEIEDQCERDQIRHNISYQIGNQTFYHGADWSAQEIPQEQQNKSEDLKKREGNRSLWNFASSLQESSENNPKDVEETKRIAYRLSTFLNQKIWGDPLNTFSQSYSMPNQGLAGFLKCTKEGNSVKIIYDAKCEKISNICEHAVMCTLDSEKSSSQYTFSITIPISALKDPSSFDTRDIQVSDITLNYQVFEPAPKTKKN